MPLTVVVGGQDGSEGKGKITSYLALRDHVDMVVRCGGPNSGHTVEVGGQRYELRLLSCGFMNPNTRLLLGIGSLIDCLRRSKNSAADWLKRFLPWANRG